MNQAARIYNMPPEMIGGERGASHICSTVGGQALVLIKFTLMPYLVRTENALRHDKDLFPPMPGGSTPYPKFAVEGILRGDSAERAAFYTAMRKIKALNANEVRELEDRPPRDGGDDYDDLDGSDAGDADVNLGAGSSGDA